MIFKKYKYHKSLDTLPIIQWTKLHESFEDIPELRYLLCLKRDLNLPKISKKLTKKLINVYKELVENIKNIDLELLSLYRQYRASTELIRLIEAKNKLRKLDNTQALAIKYNENNSLFNEYAEYLDKNYTNFNVPYYKLIDNPGKEFKEFYGYSPTPEYLKLFKYAKQFSTPYQYTLKAFEISKLKAFIDVVASEVFFNKFYKQEIEQIDSVKAHSSFLKPFYIDLNHYHRFILDRADMLDLNVVQAEPKSDYNFFKELNDISICLENGYIDPYFTAVSDYSEKKEAAYKKIETMQKPKGNA
jgi:chloramphenicol O-acetyltransferase